MRYIKHRIARLLAFGLKHPRISLSALLTCMVTTIVLIGFGFDLLSRAALSNLRTSFNVSKPLARVNHNQSKIDELVAEGDSSMEAENYSSASWNFAEAFKLAPTEKVLKEKLVLAFNKSCNQTIVKLKEYNSKYANISFLKSLHASAPLLLDEPTARQHFDEVIRTIGKNPYSASIREQMGDEALAKGELYSAEYEYNRSLMISNKHSAQLKLEKTRNLRHDVADFITESGKGPVDFYELSACEIPDTNLLVVAWADKVTDGETVVVSGFSVIERQDSNGTSRIVWTSTGQRCPTTEGIASPENEPLFENLYNPEVVVHQTWKYLGNPVVTVQGNCGAACVQMVVVGLKERKPMILDKICAEASEFWNDEKQNELLVTRARTQGAGVAEIPRIYEWNTEYLLDASEKYPQYFANGLTEYTNDAGQHFSLKDITECSEGFIDMAVMYDRAGKHEVALAMFKRLRDLCGDNKYFQDLLNDEINLLSHGQPAK